MLRIEVPTLWHSPSITSSFPTAWTSSPRSTPIRTPFAAGLFVKTGSRDESADVNGVSHFLEHMMFKGSSKYTWEDVNRIFDEIGRQVQRVHQQEMTAYYANVLPEFTEQAIEHLSHLLRPAIRVEDFTTEKKVILEEIAMYLDDPGHRLYEKLMEVALRQPPAVDEHPGLGRVDPEARSATQMADYFTSRYGPGNMVLSATGKLDFDEIVQLAEKYMGDWPHVDAPRQQPQPLYKPQRLAMTDPEAQPPIHDGHDARPQRAGRPPLRRPRAGRRDRRQRRQPLLLGPGGQRHRRGRRLRLLSRTTAAAASTSPSPPTPSAPTRRWTSP